MRRLKAMISLCVMVTIIFSSFVYANASSLFKEESFKKSLNSNELEAYQKALNGVTDDPDFKYYNINEDNLRINVNIDSEEIELIESRYETTTVLQSNVGNIKNYEAYVFVKETFRDNKKITPFGSSSEEDSDDTYSVDYLIKFNYDKISTPSSGIRPNNSQMKIISTNSGVQVGEALIKQRVWGTVYNTQTGKSHASDSYSRDIYITKPSTGTNYSRDFTSPSHYYYNEVANGQCEFGVTLTLHRSISSKFWEYTTGFLGINN